MPPALSTRLLSRTAATYLRYMPIARGKTALWRQVSKIAVAPMGATWLRTSGLTEAEYGFFVGGTKEPHTVAVLRTLLAPHMICVDVGANIGYYSLLMAPHVRRVHAYEPTPALAERIRQNIALNGMTNVDVHQVAASDRAGSAVLHLSPEDPEANSLFGAGAGVTVPTAPLDMLLDQVDMMKIDCEGSELAVLRGAQRLLHQHPILLLECNTQSLEAAGSSVAALVATLRAHHYQLYTLEQLRSDVWNVLALHHRAPPIDLPLFA